MALTKEERNKIIEEETLKRELNKDRNLMAELLGPKTLWDYTVNFVGVAIIIFVIYDAFSR